MHLCTVKTVIWQIFSNRPGKKVPQSARLSAGGGVYSLFGQCPNRGDANFKGASLTTPNKPSKIPHKPSKIPNKPSQILKKNHPKYLINYLKYQINNLKYQINHPKYHINHAQYQVFHPKCLKSISNPKFSFIKNLKQQKVSPK